MARSVASLALVSAISRAQTTTTEVSIHPRMDEDVYLVLDHYDPKTKKVVIVVFVNALINWVWIGFVLAAVCVQLRLLCNLLDGMVAIEGGKQSPTGMLYNEFPDRVADSLFLVALGYAAGCGWGTMWPP